MPGLLDPYARAARSLFDGSLNLPDMGPPRAQTSLPRLLPELEQSPAYRAMQQHRFGPPPAHRSPPAGGRPPNAAPGTTNNGRVSLPRLPDSVDWDFIRGDEAHGDEILNISVPPHSPSSGATVAHGFDTHQHDDADMRRLQIPDDLRRQLGRYVPYQGARAEAYVGANPGRITDAQAALLDQRTMTDEYNRVVRHFNAAARNGVAFEALPADLQTAIMDVAHQYGPLWRRTPQFWGDVTQGDWNEAYNELMDFGDHHPTRRRLDAERVQRAIRSGNLPGANRTDPQ